MKKISDKTSFNSNNSKIFEQASKYALAYMKEIHRRNPFPSSTALQNLVDFDEQLPLESSDASDILAKLHTIGSPATTAQTGGRYFGFVTGGAFPVALASKWLTDVWDQNSGLYAMSPVCSAIESITERWLRELLGLPKMTVTSFLSGSSMAIFCGLAAARYRLYQRCGWDFNRKGHRGAPVIRIVAPDSAHSAVIKSLGLLGFGLDTVEWVATDDQGRLDITHLPTLDDTTIVILQAGNVNTGSFDPFDEVCMRANKVGAWVHIDGAFGLWAAASKELRHLTAGMEKAQSWSVDGHKTLNTPYDSGMLLCVDQEALTASMQSSGSYLNFSEQRDGMVYTPEMSRRARAIELWATLKYLGQQGVDQLVSQLHERALQFASELTDNGFKVLNQVVFNQVLVGFDEDDDYTQKLVSEIQASGECWVGTSRWDNQLVIRISVCSWVTTEEDISRSVNAFVAARNLIAS